MLYRVSWIKRAAAPAITGLAALLLAGCQTGQQLHPPSSARAKASSYQHRSVRGAQLQPAPGRNAGDSALRLECYRWLGVPYRVGGANMAGADCSGFTLAIFQKVYGLKLPRTSMTQFASGTQVHLTQLREGDLVFFQTSNQARVTHVGIYLGGGKFAHASTKRGVTISRLDDTYYSARYRGARRLLKS